MNRDHPSQAPERAFFRRRDVLFLMAAAVIVLALFVLTKVGRTEAVPEALIYYDRRLIDRIVLNAGVEREYRYPEHPHILIHQYADQTIAFDASDCPDQLCVKTGKIGRPGAFSACMPNRFLIVIAYPDDARGTQEVDIVA